MPPDVVGRIVDLVTVPPPTGKYDALKQRLTDSFAGTPNERAARILDITDLGGRRPSALKDELRNLSRGEDGDFLLRAVFLHPLPDDLRKVVRDSSKLLEEMAKATDEHYNTAGATLDPRRNVNAAGSDADDADNVAAFRRQRDCAEKTRQEPLLLP